MTSDQLPLWVVIMFSCIGVFAVGVAIYILRETRIPGNFSPKRFYAASHERVRSAGLEAIKRLNYRVADLETDSISFTSDYFSIEAAIFPVVHVVMLPTHDDRTAVELVGRPMKGGYRWYALGQAFLLELDRSLSET